MRSKYCILLCFFLSLQLRLGESGITSLITTQLAQINIKGEKGNNIQKKKKVKIVDTKVIIDDSSKSGTEIQEVDKNNAGLSLDNMDKTDLYMKFAATAAAFVLSKLLNKLDYKNAQIILLSRVVYFSYLILTQLLVFYIKSKINKANNKTFIELTSPGFMGQTKSTSKKITVKDYDLQEAQKLTSSLFMEILFVLFVHIKQKKVQPLFYLPIMSIFNKISNPIIRIHLLGEKAINKLSRPFKTGFEDMFEKLNQQPKSESEVTVGVGRDEEKQEASDIAPNLVLDNEEVSGKNDPLKPTTTKTTPNLVDDHQVQVEDEEDLEEEETVTATVKDELMNATASEVHTEELSFVDDSQSEVEEEPQQSQEGSLLVEEEEVDGVSIDENTDVEL